MSNPLITQTTTLGKIADGLRIHTKLQNFFGIGGVNGEPMSSIANRVMQMLLTKRMPWTFNVDEYAPFPWGTGNFMVCQPGFQDIKFAGASVFVLLPQSFNGLTSNMPVGGVGVDLQSTVKTIDGNTYTYPPINGGTNAVSIDPVTGIISVQTLDPHPYQTQSIGGPQAFLTGIVNPAFNSVYTYNNIISTARWTQGFNFVALDGPNNFTLQGIQGQQYASLTAISATNGITTVAVPNAMSKGDVMTFSSVATNTGLNSVTVTLLTASSTQVTFATPDGLNITNGADTGYIFAAPSGAAGIFNFSWLQAADVFDMNSLAFPPPIDQAKAVHRKAKEYTTTGDKLEIAPVVDYNNGVIKFRLTEPLGTYPWGFCLSIQRRASTMSQRGDVFPWPDELQFVIFEMCLWQGMRQAYGISSAETMAQMQIAMGAVMAALESQDREDNTQSLTPDWSLMR
jgi:hypothetical protein